MVAAAAPASAQTLRWKLAERQGAIYELTGTGVADVTDGVPMRTLFGPDLDEGRLPREPVGRMHELLFHYIFQLPPEPLKSGKGAWTLAETHARFPSGHGDVRVEGEAQARSQGGRTTIAWRLELKGPPPPPPPPAGQNPPNPPSFEGGTLAATSVFHDKRGLLLQADFQLVWRTRGQEKRAEGRAALKDLVDLTSQALKRAADEAVKKALVQVLKPYLQRKEYARQQSQTLGHLAVVLYAALHAGLSPQDPVARAAFDDLEKLPTDEVYSVALAILALEAKGFERARPPDRSDRDRTRARFKQGEANPRDKALLERLTKWLIEARVPGRGVWSYKAHDAAGAQGHGGGDHSNTQFAVLALHAAQRSGVEVPHAVWLEIAKHFVELQMQGPVYPVDLELEPASLFGEAASADRDAERGGTTVGRPNPADQSANENARRARGFDYGVSGAWSDYGSMTAAGASSLAVAYRWIHDRPDADAKLCAAMRRGVLDGLAWLAKHHTMRHNWPGRGWPAYHLYSLEKAFETARVVALGGHDWWAEGAQELLLREDARGGWYNQSATETALCVLFLTRATQEPEVEVRALERKATGGRASDSEAEDAVLIEGLGVVRLAEVAAGLDVESADLRKERMALLDRALAAALEDQRPHAMLPLAQQLGARHADLRKNAQRVLRDIAGRRIADAEDARAVHAAWEELRRFAARQDPDAIASVRARLREPDGAPCVKRQAALALGRLRAVEAGTDLMDALASSGDAAFRALVHHVLVGLAGQGVDYRADGSASERAEGVERWRALWTREGGRWLETEDLRRLAGALGLDARRAEARRRLEAYGDRAAPTLIDALGTPHPYGDAVARDRQIAEVLRAITGEDLGPSRERWEAWRREKAR